MQYTKSFRAFTTEQSRESPVNVPNLRHDLKDVAKDDIGVRAHVFVLQLILAVHEVGEDRAQDGRLVDAPGCWGDAVEDGLYGALYMHFELWEEGALLVSNLEYHFHLARPGKLYKQRKEVSL